MRLSTFLRTEDDRTLTLLRFVLGAVMFAHGAQKVMGWFGGAGYGPSMAFLTQTLHIPAFLAFLAIAAEFLGGAGLLLGLLGRLDAFAIAVNMLAAIMLVHGQNGFFMNWSGSQPGEGIEYHLLALAMAAVIVLRGSGAWSLDRLLERNLTSGDSGTYIWSGTASLPGGYMAFYRRMFAFMRF
ncbi:MAG TPA: DoxX family protein [Bryobacteraceae bacterium]|jgi:putative oxidoreductase|nr:DoxX family protein [Bryobacteraceae bacterium]